MVYLEIHSMDIKRQEVVIDIMAGKSSREK